MYTPALEQLSQIIEKLFTYSMVLVRKRTMPTKRPPLVGEVSENFFG
jgi:hypothetical protein